MSVCISIIIHNSTNCFKIELWNKLDHFKLLELELQNKAVNNVNYYFILDPFTFLCIVYLWCVKKDILIFIIQGLHLYCCIHNVLVDVSPGFLQVFLVELRSLYGTSDYVLYLIHGGRVASSDPVNHNQVHVLNFPFLLLACSQEWTNSYNRVLLDT